MLLKRGEKVCAFLGVAMVVAGVAARLVDGQPRREMVLHTEGFTIPVTVLEPPTAARLGAAIVLHGLSANRGIMNTLGRAFARDGITAYVADLSGHGDNTDPFSFATAEKSAAAAIRKLLLEGEIRPERAVLVGHSMGGDIVLRMAEQFPAAATVAISPGPLVPLPPPFERLRIYERPARLPGNLLQQAGWMDLPLFEWAALGLMKSAGGPRASDEDFRGGQAIAVRTIPWATHTGLVFNPTAIEQALRWTRRAWGEPPPVPAPDRTVLLRAGAIAGVGLLFPALASALAFSIAGRTNQPESPGGFVAGRPLRAWILAAVFAAILLKYFVPLGFLRIAFGEYLGSFLLLVSALFFVCLGRAGRELRKIVAHQACEWRELLSGTVLGIAIVLGLGLTVSGDFGDVWMNAARVWRFAALAVCLLPFCVLEETLLGPPAHPYSSEKPSKTRWECLRTRARRWRHFFALRGILWLAILGALVWLDSRQILLAVMALFLVVFSFGQRVGADIVRQRFASTAAAAAFNAILAAWFLAAVFPLR